METFPFLLNCSLKLIHWKIFLFQFTARVFVCFIVSVTQWNETQNLLNLHINMIVDFFIAFSLWLSRFSFKMVSRSTSLREDKRERRPPKIILKDFMRAFDHNSLHHNCWPFSLKWLNWESGANLFYLKIIRLLGKDSFIMGNYVAFAYILIQMPMG